LLSSPVDIQTKDGSTFHNPVTLTSDLSTPGSTHAEVVPWGIRVPSLVLIAQVVFLLEREHTHIHAQTQTHKVTDAADRLIIASISYCRPYSTA